MGGCGLEIKFRKRIDHTSDQLIDLIYEMKCTLSIAARSHPHPVISGGQTSCLYMTAEYDH